MHCPRALFERVVVMACDVLAFVLRNDVEGGEESGCVGNEGSACVGNEGSECAGNEGSACAGNEVQNPTRNDETPFYRNEGVVESAGDSEKPAESDNTEATFDSLATLIFTALSRLVLETEKEGPVPSLDPVAPKVTPRLFSHD